MRHRRLRSTAHPPPDAGRARSDRCVRRHSPNPKLRQKGGGRVQSHVPDADLPAAIALADRNQPIEMLSRLGRWRASDPASQTQSP